MESPRLVGYIVAVHGFRVKVELSPETRSPVRATLDGAQTAVAINAILTFALGAGRLAIGVVTDLEARETYDTNPSEELTLELTKPRRIATVQLLGTIETVGTRSEFSPGIYTLPTLDTPAEIGTPMVLRTVFETPPQRNRPEGYVGDDYDCDISLGKPSGQSGSSLRASYNDLLSRPLAIVGNTGSGKSYTVSSVIQKAMAALSAEAREPHVFVLDINGEYGRAFVGAKGEDHRKPDEIYLDGRPFGIPLWLLNAEEVCAWLSAAEQTQEPVLKDWWAIAKGGEQAKIATSNALRYALSTLEQLLSDLPGLKRKNAGSYCDGIVSYLKPKGIDSAAFEALFESHRKVDKFNAEVVTNQLEILEQAQALRKSINDVLAQSDSAQRTAVRTADSPLFVSMATLADPSMVNRAVSKEDLFRVEAHLTTLKLRLKTRLDDRRWRSFLSYESGETRCESLATWFDQLGVGRIGGRRVAVVDLSMLSSEVLPYACAVVGRVLLEAREALPAARRYKHPWVLVLEEAHNYARPGMATEERGQRLSRLAYERIAKEGRKFGLSLIIASQRPSEVSQTIVSQCANFISHRLQNPDDIDHFKRIIPIQARRLLDQVTILAAGEAIVFGSAFHVPTRVVIDMPQPGPFSQTAAPYHEWLTETEPFPLTDVLSAWGVARPVADAETSPSRESKPNPRAKSTVTSPARTRR